MIKSILIVGGGSAGWITANVLHSVLNQKTAPEIDIHLVESPTIPALGVGEATVPSIRRTFQTMGIAEAEMMRATDATFKSLIRFTDWNLEQSFDHPFDRRKRPETDLSVLGWLQQGHAPGEYAKAFSMLSHLADRGHAPKALGWPDYTSTFPYAYHLDAIKLAAFLSKTGCQRGIEHTLANITDITIDEAGDITHVMTDTGTRLEADLYIDCTGFRAALIGGALDEPYQDYSQHLLCDRAVTLQVPYDIKRPESLRPYTLATARNAGWSWDINLRNRRGLGYVYSSQFISSQDAERDLKEAEGPHAQALDANHIAFQSGKRARSWVGNCIAVGLSGGFLEPLESSGLYMIEFAAQALAEFIPHTRSVHTHTADLFNSRIDAVYAEVLDYINLHYVLSTRHDTPFWQAASAPETMPDSLKARFELWKTKRPTDLDFANNNRLFSLESYEYLLFGMAHTKENSVPLGAPVPPLHEMLEKCYAKMPQHEDWLASLGG